MNTNRIEVRVNGYKHPQEDKQYDFSNANESYSNAYQRFLQLGCKHKNLDNRTIVSYNGLKEYILYFVLMIQSMNTIVIEVDQLLI